MVQELAAAKIKRSMKHKTTSSTDNIYMPGEPLPVWRDKIVNNQIDEFIFPFTILTSILYQ